MKTALIPGSFDPITLGHIDVITRCARMFDHVLVVAMINRRKEYLFSKEERLALITSGLKALSNVTVDFWDGMLFEYANAHQVCAIIKGIRTSADYEYELRQADYNNARSGAQTLFLPAKEELAGISSTGVKQKFFDGLDVSAMVHPEVLDMLNQKK